MRALSGLTAVRSWQTGYWKTRRLMKVRSRRNSAISGRVLTASQDLLIYYDFIWSSTTAPCLHYIQCHLWYWKFIWIQSPSYFAPRSNDWGHFVLSFHFHLPVCLSIRVSVVNFNRHCNFWTVRNRDFICFGNHTPLIMPFPSRWRSMTFWTWL